MSHPDPTQDYCCEYWSEIDGECSDGRTISVEWCKHSKSQCSCSGSKTECNNGQFIPQIREEEEDR